MFVAISFALYACVSNTHKNSTATVDLISKVSQFEIAKTTESYMTDSLAHRFPETLMFLGRTDNKGGYMLLMNSLPNTYDMYKEYKAKMNTDMSKYFSWVNITLIDNGNNTLGLLPRHAFVDDSELTGVMTSYGMNFSEKKDLICINLKKSDQSLPVLPLDELNGEKINGSPCTVRTLNCTGDNGEICQYVIQGKVYWINPSDKAELSNFGRTSNGGPIYEIPGKGMYVIRVEDKLWKKIPGMSGGSAVVSIDGKDYLLGLNTERIGLMSISPTKDTTMFVMLAVQPITTSDIKN